MSKTYLPYDPDQPLLLPQALREYASPHSPAGGSWASPLQPGPPVGPTHVDAGPRFYRNPPAELPPVGGFLPTISESLP